MYLFCSVNQYIQYVLPAFMYYQTTYDTGVIHLKMLSIPVD